MLRELRGIESGLAAVARRLEALGEDTGLPGLLAECTALTDAYESRDGNSADERVAVSLHALGLPDLDRDRPLGTLSGGGQGRLALAAALSSQAEALLLDETRTTSTRAPWPGSRTGCRRTAGRLSP